MGRGKKIPLNSAVLRWAVAESGYSVEALAERLKLPREVLEAWLKGHDQPSTTYFHKLVEVLKRPSSVFFFQAVPERSLPPLQFRGPVGSDRKQLVPREIQVVREVARVQNVLSWLSDELDEGNASIPSLTVGSDSEAAGGALRAALEVELPEQARWQTASEAFAAWRAAAERIGVVVSLQALGHDSVRGFSLWDPRVPLLVVNTAWNKSARIFSMMHELAHLATKTNSACLETHGSSKPLPQTTDTTERWCEAVAAAILLPWDAVNTLLRNECQIAENRQVDDLAVIYKIARRFKVSSRAAAIRLIRKERMGWALYKQLPPIGDAKPAGGGGTGRDRIQTRKDEYGSLVPGMLFKATARDLLGRAEVASYLRVSEDELDRWDAPASDRVLA